jgi:uncharacterized protein YbjQ (UPF0145 family)
VPLFHRRSDEEKRRDEELANLARQHAHDQQASLTEIEGGGLPLQATKRLRDLADHPGLFTSDLSVSEVALNRHAGIQPITQVMGSAFYHVGWQAMPGFMYMSGELETVSEAYRQARRLALSRLQQEAALVQADAVIGVRLKTAEYEWGANNVEFSAIGTAVRLDSLAQKHKHPVLTDLSGQDFYKLMRAGYSPAGIAAGTCVFYAVAPILSFGMVWSNQEITDFTRGQMAARDIACFDLEEEAGKLGAGGVVGMNVTSHHRAHEIEQGGGHRTDMIFTFHALGTAILSTDQTRSASGSFSMVKPLGGRGHSRRTDTQLRETQI